jgi:hypothetical protein
MSILQRYHDVPKAYREWLALLTAEALRRRGHSSKARDAILEAGPYWETSWNQWAEVAQSRIKSRHDSENRRREHFVKAQ